MQVRLQEPDSPPLIDMRVALVTMDKLRLGLADRRLDASEAKTRLATLLAGRAVALALTPGIPPIEHISMQPRGGVMGRLLFENLVRHGCASLAHPMAGPDSWQGSPCEWAVLEAPQVGTHLSGAVCSSRRVLIRSRLHAGCKAACPRASMCFSMYFSLCKCCASIRT